MACHKREGSFKKLTEHNTQNNLTSYVDKPRIINDNWGSTCHLLKYIYC